MHVSVSISISISIYFISNLSILALSFLHVLSFFSSASLPFPSLLPRYSSLLCCLTFLLFSSLLPLFHSLLISFLTSHFPSLLFSPLLFSSLLFSSASLSFSSYLFPYVTLSFSSLFFCLAFLQVINRSPKYKNKYVHRRSSVSLDNLTPEEVRTV